MEHNRYKIRIENVWGEKTETLINEIVGVWQELGITIGPESPRDRAKQVVFIARNEHYKIVSISTTFVDYVEHLRSKVFVLRSLVHPDFRIPGLLNMVVTNTIQFLEKNYKSIDPKCIGVYAIYENPRLQQLKTVHTPSGLTFIGFTASGKPIRAYFFKGAKFE